MCIPFAGGKAADYVMRVAVGEQVELNERNLPTGRKLPLTEQFAKLREGGLQVPIARLSKQDSPCVKSTWTASPYRGAVVENKQTGVRTFYEVNDMTTYWTIWNNGGQVPYCCPEPQSWITNAPNASDPEAAGFRSIAPGETFSMKFKLYTK